MFTVYVNTECRYLRSSAV